jgi:hypothetical protein
MAWELDSVQYLHERATATQQTGFWFVAECRAPYGIFWFGVDDAATSCLTPIFSCTNDVPECFKVGNGDMLTYSPTSAFWLFNRVSNFAYLRYSDVSADIIKVQQEFEKESLEQVRNMIFLEGSEVKALTDYSVRRAEEMMKRWKNLDEYLLVKYIDGNIKKERDNKFERTPYGLCPMPAQPHLPERERRAIVNDNGEILRAKNSNH